MDSIPAIYEDGVFKPTGPVSLPERTEVRISLPASETALPVDDAEAAAKRKAALRELFDKIEADPDLQRPGDGFSGADHDEVLYGGPDGPA